MGLDMFLYAVKKNSSADVALSNIRNDDDAIDVFYQSNERNEVGYWRKAYGVHDWFVKNIQGGNDDCSYYRVQKDDLIKLLNECVRGLANTDELRTIFPQSSFDVVEEIRNTIIAITDALIFNIEGEYNFYYYSSW